MLKGRKAWIVEEEKNYSKLFYDTIHTHTKRRKTHKIKFNKMTT